MDIIDEVQVATRVVGTGRTKWTAGEDNGVEVLVLSLPDGVEMVFPASRLIKALTDLRDGTRERRRREDRVDLVVDDLALGTIRDAIKPTTKDKANVDEVARAVKDSLERLQDLIPAALA